MAWVTGHDRDGAANGVAPEQRALRTLQDFDAVDIEHGGVGAHTAREIHTVDVNAHAGIEIEREIILSDAADVGGQHGVGPREWSAGIEVDVGSKIAQLVNAGDALFLERFSG